GGCNSAGGWRRRRRSQKIAFHDIQALHRGGERQVRKMTRMKLYFTDRHSYIEGEAGGRRHPGGCKRGVPHIWWKQGHLFPKALVMDFLSSNDSELTWGGSPLSRRRSTKMTPRYGSLLAFAFVLVLAPSLMAQTAPGPQTAGSTKTVVASNPQNPVDTSVPAA